MSTWYQPTTFKHWCRRQISLRVMAIALILVALGVTEFRLDWVEKALGAYLVSTNPARPESGTIWDQGRQAHLARQTLETVMNQRRNSQREARQADSLGQVVATIHDETGAMLSAEHFVELYLKLPPVLTSEIISPYTLLSYMSSGLWQRTFFERQDKQLLVYFLDANNQVLHRLLISQGLLAHIQRGEVAIDSSLEQLADLSVHIYPAEQFFNTLNTFPSDVRKGIISHPEDLLRVSGRIARVGISENNTAGTVDLGFAAEGTKVILVQGRMEDVRQLQWALDGSSAVVRPGSGGDQQ
jgi:hypothetical protein